MQPLHEHLSEDGASKKNEQVMLMENVLGAFETLKRTFPEAPVLSFTDFNKLFLLENNTDKLGL